MLKRVYDNLDKYFWDNRAIILYGPRRIGKTTLVNQYLKDTKLKYRLESGDNAAFASVMGSQDFDKIFELVEGFDLLVIDEAQKIQNVGMGLKILVDNRPGMRLVATGSSSFDLSNQVGEPLTGRKNELILFPMSQLELQDNGINRYDLKKNLPAYLIYGSYPEVIQAATSVKKKDILNELINSYLFKDVFELDKVKNPEVVSKLLKLLAFQVGSEVSLNELATKLGIHVATVSRYLYLLEKSFVIFRLSGLKRNLRNEVTDKGKYYFYDNGVRNALISQFNGLEHRNDIGPLWENFLMAERLKRNSYKKNYCSSYFWRTYEQKEIDLVEEKNGKFSAFEFKWNEKKKLKAPKDFSENYPNSEFLVVTPENYLDFVIGSGKSKVS